MYTWEKNSAFNGGGLACSTERPEKRILHVAEHAGEETFLDVIDKKTHGRHGAGRTIEIKGAPKGA
ncbi:MAG: hypothetical protein OXT65_06430 [Alphaproteobacteria bacterium]|nr:hypothetical protein [Alphaproteobacteria bacterium]